MYFFVLRSSCSKQFSYSLSVTENMPSFNPKGFSFQIALVGREGGTQGSYPYLRKLKIFFLKLWDCLGFRILVLSIYDEGVDR